MSDVHVQIEYVYKTKRQCRRAAVVSAVLLLLLICGIVGLVLAIISLYTNSTTYLHHFRPLSNCSNHQVQFNETIKGCQITIHSYIFIIRNDPVFCKQANDSSQWGQCGVTAQDQLFLDNPNKHALTFMSTVVACEVLILSTVALICSLFLYFDLYHYLFPCTVYKYRHSIEELSTKQ